MNPHSSGVPNFTFTAGSTFPRHFKVKEDILLSSIVGSSDRLHNFTVSKGKEKAIFTITKPWQRQHINGSELITCPATEFPKCPSTFATRLVDKTRSRPKRSGATAVQFTTTSMRASALVIIVSAGSQQQRKCGQFLCGFLSHLLRAYIPIPGVFDTTSTEPK